MFSPTLLCRFEKFCGDFASVARCAAAIGFCTARGMAAVGKLALTLVAGVALAEPLMLTVAPASPAESGYFKMGTARQPAGDEITLDSHSLRFNQRPWVPEMGEFHFTRYPAAE